MKEFVSMLRILLIVLLIVWAVFAFIIGIRMVPNDDMKPRMDAGDIMLYYRINKSPAENDVVVVTKNKTDYVGRVVARGGDTVDIKDGGNVVINGNLVTEDNIFYKTKPYKGFVDYPVKLKSDEYFILVDKRDSGEDSRYYGPVKRDDIKGIVIGIYRRSGF